MSHRVWWLMAFFALAIGLAIEREGPDAARPGSATQREVPTPAQAALAEPDALQEPADGG
jgi:hypothetical protein